MEKLNDVLSRFEQKIFDQNRNADFDLPAKPRLLSGRSPNRDFSVAALLELALKDDRHSTENPMFSLSRKPDHRVRHYEHNGNAVTIKPGSGGRADIGIKIF